MGEAGFDSPAKLAGRPLLRVPPPPAVFLLLSFYLPLALVGFVVQLVGFVVR